MRAERWLQQLSKRLGTPAAVGALPADDSLPDLLWATMPPVSDGIGLLGLSYGLAELGQLHRPMVATELCFAATLTDATQAEQWHLFMQHLVLDSRQGHLPEPGRIYSNGNACVPGFAHDRVLVTPLNGILQALLLPMNLVTFRLEYLQLIPLYAGEQALVERIGVSKFLSIPELDELNLNRPDLSIIYAHLLK